MAEVLLSEAERTFILHGVQVNVIFYYHVNVFVYVRMRYRDSKQILSCNTTERHCHAETVGDNGSEEPSRYAPRWTYGHTLSHTG